MIKKIIYCLIFILLSSIYPAQKTDKEKEVDSLFHAVNLLGDANTNNKTEEVLKFVLKYITKQKKLIIQMPKPGHWSISILFIFKLVT